MPAVHLTAWIDSKTEWERDWTKNHAVAIIHRPFNWAAKQRLITTNPFRGVTHPKPRVIPLDPEVVGLLVAIRGRNEPGEFVFYNHRKTPWNRSNLSLRLQRGRKKAVIPPDAKLYDLRHAYGTRALHRKPQDKPSRERKLDGVAEARLVAVVCSKAPAGRAEWTMQLLADKLVELGWWTRSRTRRSGGRSRNAVKPWHKEQWCLPGEPSGEFVTRMEDVIEVYHRPLDPDRCLGGVRSG